MDAKILFCLVVFAVITTVISRPYAELCGFQKCYENECCTRLFFPKWFCEKRPKGGEECILKCPCVKGFECNLKYRYNLLMTHIQRGRGAVSEIDLMKYPIRNIWISFMLYKGRFAKFFNHVLLP